jgi:hypothetical protein
MHIAPIGARDLINEGGPMTKSPNGGRESWRKGANVPYIEPPTIPSGMTVETYRCVRARRKPHGIRRLASPTSWLG